MNGGTDQERVSLYRGLTVVLWLTISDAAMMRRRLSNLKVQTNIMGMNRDSGEFGLLRGGGNKAQCRQGLEQLTAWAEGAGRSQSPRSPVVK